MSKFSKFMKANKVVRENTKYAATSSLVDPDTGKPMDWEIKPLTTAETQRMQDECTMDIPCLLYTSRITADSAEPKSIDRLRELGLSRIRKARKGKDSINSGIDFIQDFKIIIHPRCVNFLTEISNYTWAIDKFGKKLNKPIDDFNHLMDAMRYALESFSMGETFSFD